jgi:hypothetical protein
VRRYEIAVEELAFDELPINAPVLTEPISSQMVYSEAIARDRKPDHKNCFKTGVPSIGLRTAGVSPLLRHKN